MPLVRSEPTVPAREQSQTHALDCSANGIGISERLTVLETIKQTCRYGNISEVSEQVTINNGQQIKDTHHAM